jgi:hypothetical protein
MTNSDNAPQDRRLRETAESLHPGWTRLQWEAVADGHMLNTQFRGPGGDILSRHEYRRRIASGEIATARKVASSSPSSSAPRAAASSSPDAPVSLPELPELPEVKPSTRATAPGRASAADASLLFQIALTIGSSLTAWFSDVPEVAMSEMESQSISVPLANLFAKSRLNDQIGRYLVGSSDYGLLALALYSYGKRALDQIRTRVEFEAAHGSTGPAVAGGMSYAAPYAPIQYPQPAGQPASAGHTAAGATSAAGGILAAANGGAQSAQAANIVGFNPI